MQSPTTQSPSARAPAPCPPGTRGPRGQPPYHHPQPQRQPQPARSTHSVRAAGSAPGSRSASPRASAVGDLAAVDLRAASPEGLLRYEGYRPRYPSPARDGEGPAPPRPVLGLRRLLPCPLRSEPRGCARAAPEGAPPEDTERAFEEAYCYVVASIRGPSRARWPGIEMDDWLGGLTTETLWRIGCLVSRAAPYHVPGFTRFHCLAMCVADRLVERGVQVR